MDHEDGSCCKVLEVEVLAIPGCEPTTEIHPVATGEAESAGCGEGGPSRSSTDARGQDREVRDAVERDRQRPRNAGARLHSVRIRRGKSLDGVVECLRDADCASSLGLGRYRHQEHRAKGGYSRHESLHKRSSSFSTRRADKAESTALTIPGAKSIRTSPDGQSLRGRVSTMSFRPGTKIRLAGNGIGVSGG